MGQLGAGDPGGVGEANRRATGLDTDSILFFLVPWEWHGSVANVRCLSAAPSRAGTEGGCGVEWDRGGGGDWERGEAGGSRSRCETLSLLWQEPFGRDPVGFARSSDPHPREREDPIAVVPRSSPSDKDLQTRVVFAPSWQCPSFPPLTPRSPWAKTVSS